MFLLFQRLRARIVHHPGGSDKYLLTLLSDYDDHGEKQQNGSSAFAQGS